MKLIAISRCLLPLAVLGVLPVGCDVLDLGSDESKKLTTIPGTDAGGIDAGRIDADIIVDPPAAVDAHAAPDAMVAVDAVVPPPTGGRCALMEGPGAFCVTSDPRKPQQEPVNVTGTVVAVGVTGACSAPSPGLKGLQVKSASGEITKVDIVLPGLDLPVKVGDAVTIGFHGGAPPTMAFSSYYPAITITKADKLVAFSGRPSSYFPGGNPGGISFTSGALICTGSHQCGDIRYYALKATTPATSISIGQGQAGSLAGYRIVNNLIASSGMSQCADWGVSEMQVSMVAE